LSTYEDGYAEKNPKHEIQKFIGYQGISLPGSGYQDIRESGLEILWFPLSLMSWCPDSLIPTGSHTSFHNTLGIPLS
jgi:hypothetical protein